MSSLLLIHVRRVGSLSVLYTDFTSGNYWVLDIIASTSFPDYIVLQGFLIGIYMLCPLTIPVCYLMFYFSRL